MEKRDWSLTPAFDLRREIPNGFNDISSVILEIDVLWIAAGRNTIEGLFEVKHSTSIYSGLLRFNDVLLTAPGVAQFYVVSDEKRRDRFSRQAYRPTFRHSGSSERTSFLEYANVLDRHQRLLKGKSYEEIKILSRNFMLSSTSGAVLPSAPIFSAGKPTRSGNSTSW